MGMLLFVVTCEVTCSQSDYTGPLMCCSWDRCTTQYLPPRSNTNWTPGTKSWSREALVASLVFGSVQRSSVSSPGSQGPPLFLISAVWQPFLAYDA